MSFCVSLMMIYLKVPEEILIVITMQQQQKYFPLFDSAIIN